MDTEPEATQRGKRKASPAEEDRADAAHEKDNKKQGEQEAENSGSGSDRADTERDEDDDVLPAAMTSHDAADCIASIKPTKQIFHKSFSHRDDWLHRGMQLHDMDYYHYARYMERVELPRTGNAQKFQNANGFYFWVEAHYSLAKNFVQVLRRKCGTNV